MTIASLMADYDKVKSEISDVEHQLAGLRKRAEEIRGAIIATDSRSPRGEAIEDRLRDCHVATMIRPKPSRRRERGAPRVMRETLDAVQTMPNGSVTAERLANTMGIDRAKARVRLSRAERAGFLVREGHGRYRLPLPSGKALMAQQQRTEKIGDDHS